MSSDAVQPQDAFAELAGITLPEQSLDTVMDTVARLIKRTIRGAAEVSVTIVERGQAKTVASTGRLATDLDERQYERGYGPCLACVEGNQPIVINDLVRDARWRHGALDATERLVATSSCWNRRWSASPCARRPSS